MKKINYITMLIIALISFCKCKSDDYYYADLIKDKDIIFPGKIDSLTFKGGENRLLLTAKLPTDSKVNQLILYWNNNNKLDSILLGIDEKDIGQTHEFLVENVTENVYNFDVYTVNLKGHKSIKSQTFGRVYGKSYKSSLVNRILNSSSLNDDGSATLRFISETNISFKSTKVTFTDNDNITKTVKFGREVNSINLPKYKKGTDIIYEAGYLPITTALDTLYSAKSTLTLQ